jgi:hypothetical protein
MNLLTFLKIWNHFTEGCFSWRFSLHAELLKLRMVNIKYVTTFEILRRLTVKVEKTFSASVYMMMSPTWELVPSFVQYWVHFIWSKKTDIYIYNIIICKTLLNILFCKLNFQYYFQISFLNRCNVSFANFSADKMSF